LPFHTNLDEYEEEDIASCHTRRLRRLHIDQMDPSMLIAFLIRDENDWNNWSQEMSNVEGKPILHIADTEPVFHEEIKPRPDAVDEVETLDDDVEEDDGELINLPTTPA
jgi:cysteine protease ATG4